MTREQSAVHTGMLREAESVAWAKAVRKYKILNHADKDSAFRSVFSWAFWSGSEFGLSHALNMVDDAIGGNPS